MTDASALNARLHWQGGEGSEAIFTHANGFPPLTYRPFLDALSEQLRCRAFAFRPLLGGPVAPVPWAQLGEDVVEAMGPGPVIGIGHSMGATSLIYAAAAHPKRFSALVLIEPAMVSPLMALAIRLVPRPLLMRLQPAKGTLAKSDTWASTEAFLQSCQRSGLYTRVGEAHMRAFADGALRPGGLGVELVYPKEWEAAYYAIAPSPVRALRSVRCPILGVRGMPSIFLDDRRWNRCVRAQPNGWYRQLDGGHLLPLERPEETAALVLQGLGEQGLL